MLQLDPPCQCHPEVHPKCLLSTKKWARKNQKMSKTANGDLTRTNPNPPFSEFLAKISIFNNQNLIGAIAQTKGPMIKMNKTNFEVHRWRTNFHLFTLVLDLGFWEVPAI